METDTSVGIPELKNVPRLSFKGDCTIVNQPDEPERFRPDSLRRSKMWQSIKKAAPAVVVLVSLLILVPATAEAKTSSFMIKEARSACPYGGVFKPTLVRKYQRSYRAVQAKYGENAPGRNIVCDGLKSRHGVQVPTVRKVRQSIYVLEYMIRPKVVGSLLTVREPGASSSAIVGGSTGGLSSIASCESGGDPTAVSPDGQYRGKYQFDYSTWQSVGGSGDPAAAPEAEQDRRAAMLYAQRGSAPWPVCGQ